MLDQAVEPLAHETTDCDLTKFGARSCQDGPWTTHPSPRSDVILCHTR